MAENETEETWDTEDGDEGSESKYAALEIGDELVEDLPPAAGSLYAEAIGKLIELSAQSETGGWLRISTGGRGANSVQAGLQTAAKNLGVKIKTRTRKEGSDKAVFVSLADDDETEDEAAVDAEG